MTVLVRSVYGSKVLGGYMYEQSRVDNKNQDMEFSIRICSNLLICVTTDIIIEILGRSLTVGWTAELSNRLLTKVFGA